MLRLTFVRHATTEWNEQRRYQGWGDPPLSPAGRSEARRLAVRFGPERWDMVFTSDLRRTRETSEIALPEVWAEPDPRLRELSWGAWEGLTYDEIMQRDPELLRAWTADPSSTVPPGGESLASFQTRVGEALDTLPETGDVLWITHAGVIRVALTRLLGVSLAAAMHLRMAPTGVTQAEIHPGGGAVVSCVNATGHLGAGMIALTDPRLR